MLPELTGPWICEAQALRAVVASAPAAGSSWQASASRAGVSVKAGVAIIGISGMITKSARWWFDGTSSIEVMQQVQAAAADPNVTAILLGIDSPGGTVAGTGELAAAVAAADRVKPTYAQVQDLCASGAFWVGSQAGKIFANPTALVGSIGTYGVLIDSSGMADKAGIKVHVVRAGALKGMGIPGTPIEKAHLEQAQSIITGLNEHFLTAVSAGRRLPMKRVRELADGRIHLAADAVKLGLIDGVQSLQATYEALALGKGQAIQPAAVRGPTTKGTTMDAKERWDAAVAAHVANGKSPADAIRAVVREDPELHQEYLAEHNALHNKELQRRR